MKSQRFIGAKFHQQYQKKNTNNEVNNIKEVKGYKCKQYFCNSDIFKLVSKFSENASVVRYENIFIFFWKSIKIAGLTQKTGPVGKRKHRYFFRTKHSFKIILSFQTV